jgi:hypothetical protein
MSVLRAELRYDSAEAPVGPVPGSETEDGRKKLRSLAELALTAPLEPLRPSSGPSPGESEGDGTAAAAR